MVKSENEVYNFPKHFLNIVLKLINNSSSLNKENHDRDGVWISDLNQHRFLRFYFSVFFLVLVAIEKIYQTLKTVFDHTSKQLTIRQKYSAACRIANSLLGVSKCAQWSNMVLREGITACLNVGGH